MKIIKNILKIIGVIILLIVVFIFSLDVYFDKKIRQTNVSLFKEDGIYDYLIAIPIQIQDSSYYFLWDTGATYSSVDYELLDSLNLIHNKENTFKVRFFTVDTIIEETFKRKTIRCQLGDFSTYIRFLIDDKNFIKTVASDLPPQITGIIGQNVISQFNWLFDFEKSIVTISKDPIFIEKNNSTLEIPFTTNKKREHNVPFFNLKISTLDSLKFYFDSGYAYIRYFSLDSMNYRLHPSFILSDSLVKSPIGGINYTIYSTVHPGEDIKQIKIFDSISVNGFPLEHISMFNRTASYRDVNYLTSSFIYQFEKMYYNSRDKEISLIGYRGNTYPTGDEEKLIRYLRENYAISK